MGALTQASEQIARQIAQAAINKFTWGNASSKLQNRVSVMEYGASGSDLSTTGSISAGTRRLVLNAVASNQDFQKDQYVCVEGAGTDGGSPETACLTFDDTGIATGSGNLTIALDGVSYSVGVANGATAATVASNIVKTAFPGWKVYRFNNAVFFKSLANGTKSDATFSSAVPGITGTMQTVNQGTNGTQLVSKIVSIAGNILMLDNAATATVSSVFTRHDDTQAILTALDNVRDGGEIYFPMGTYYTAPIYLGKDIRFMGESIQLSRIRLRKGANTDVIVLDNRSLYCEIKNLSVDGNKAENTYGNGIAILGDRDNSVGGGSTARKDLSVSSGTYLFLHIDRVQVMNCANNGLFILPFVFASVFSNITVYDNNEYGIANASTDNHFALIEAELSGKAGVLESGANNRWTSVKCYWNCYVDKTYGGFTLRKSSRNTIVGVEVQDGYGHGFLIQDCTGDGLSLIACLADGNGYMDVGNLTTTRAHQGFRILGSKNVTLLGCIAANYRSGITGTFIQDRGLYIDAQCDDIVIQIKAPYHNRAPYIAGTNCKVIDYPQVRIPKIAGDIPSLLYANSATANVPTMVDGYTVGNKAISLAKTNTEYLSFDWNGAVNPKVGTIEIVFKLNSIADLPAGFPRLLDIGKYTADLSADWIGLILGSDVDNGNFLRGHIYTASNAMTASSTNGQLPIVAGKWYKAVMQWNIDSVKKTIKTYFFDEDDTMYSKVQEFTSNLAVPTFTGIPTAYINGRSDATTMEKTDIVVDSLRISNRMLHPWEFYFKTMFPIESTTYFVNFADGKLSNGGRQPSGPTANRPSPAVTGQLYFDTTLGKTVSYNGASWV